MDSSKLNDWLQVVGLFGVMASMVFVGFQIRQDREIAMSDSYQMRTAMVVQSFDSRAANTEALSAELRILGINPDDPLKNPPVHIPESAGPLTELEYRAGFFSSVSTWNQWENSFYQFEAGFLPESHWLRIRSVIKRQFVRKTLHSVVFTGGSWRPSFRREVEEIIAEVQAEISS